MQTNRYRTLCYTCGTRVKSGAGFVEKSGRDWRGYCAKCAELQTASADSQLRQFTDVDAQWENWASELTAERY